MDSSWPNEVYSLISNESIRQISKKQRTDQPGNRHGKIVIHCFKGGHNSPQELAIIEAISIFIKKNLVIFEVMTCDDVKTQRMDEKQLVDWLLDCDIHLIITHLHQNTAELLRWNMSTLMYEVQRLYCHDGYPYRNRLRDPIFLQNKFSYLELIPNITNNTLKVEIRKANCYTDADLCSIKTFIEDIKAEKWMLKLAFVTNSFHSRSAKNYEEILQHLKHYSKVLYGIYPYVMLQPYLLNRKEYKVVVFDGKAQYIATSAKRRGERSFAKDNLEALLNFAEYAVMMLKEKSDDIDCEGIIRVDIMQSNSSHMIVNEFESLEACIWSSGRCVNQEGIMLRYQAAFWRTQLLKFIPLNNT